MRPNIGARDRMIRFIIGMVLAAAGIYVTNRINVWQSPARVTDRLRSLA